MYYKVPFTGYYLVEADSPQKAKEKAKKGASIKSSEVLKKARKVKKMDYFRLLVSCHYSSFISDRSRSLVPPLSSVKKTSLVTDLSLFGHKTIIDLEKDQPVDFDKEPEDPDAHSCRAHADAYGICQWCGAIVSGTSADYELHGYDPV